jgi:Zn-dependent protease
MVALAGPLSNLILMFIFVGLFYIFEKSANDFILSFFYLSGLINLFLAIFNLFPIVPLDGSKILFAFLPKNIYQQTRDFLEKNYLYIFIIFIIIIFNTNFLLY